MLAHVNLFPDSIDLPLKWPVSNFWGPLQLNRDVAYLHLDALPESFKLYVFQSLNRDVAYLHLPPAFSYGRFLEFQSLNRDVAYLHTKQPGNNYPISNPVSIAQSRCSLPPPQR